MALPGAAGKLRGPPRLGGARTMAGRRRRGAPRALPRADDGGENPDSPGSKPFEGSSSATGGSNSGSSTNSSDNSNTGATAANFTVTAAQGVLVDKSEIRFVAKQMGVDVEGRFRKWKANVAFLPKDLAKSRIEFDIDLLSIDLASEDSEKEVKDRLWFDAASGSLLVATGPRGRLYAWKDRGVRLLAQTGEGAAYRVDLRLRPNGASGLLVFTQDFRIRRKLTEDAATVEHHRARAGRHRAGTHVDARRQLGDRRCLDRQTEAAWRRHRLRHEERRQGVVGAQRRLQSGDEHRPDRSGAGRDRGVAPRVRRCRTSGWPQWPSGMSGWSDPLRSGAPRCD